MMLAKKAWSGLAVIGFALWVSSLSTALGDVDHEVLPGLAIETLHLSVEHDGNVARVLFTIDNHGTRDLVLQAVRSPVAHESALLMRQLGLGQVATEAVIVPRGETVDFASNHLSARLDGLASKLAPGDAVPVRFHFRGGSIVIEAHVHARHGEDEQAPIEPAKEADHRLTERDFGGNGVGSQERPSDRTGAFDQLDFEKQTRRVGSS